MTSGARTRLFWIVAGTVVLVDLVTKRLAVSALSSGGIPLIGDWFAFRLVYNRGAAFGIHVGEHSRWVFMGLALVALVVLGTMVWQTLPHQRFRLVALALVCGGAVGNLIDRVKSSAGVVDFIDVWIGPFHWPTFNVADMAVSCGAVALALVLWAEGKHDTTRGAEESGAARASS